MTPDMDLDDDTDIWMFYISDSWGNLQLQGSADSFATLMAMTRRIYAQYPADNLLIENAATGAGVMFVPEAPRVGTFLVDNGFMIGIQAQIYEVSDWQIWDHLTDAGRYDPTARRVDFLGDGPMLTPVTLTANILLN